MRLNDFQVKRMFESIAFSYDFQNRFLSLGRDKYWRKALAEAIQEVEGNLILDMATGTAEVAIEIGKRKPKMRIVGLDFSPRMVALGWTKVRAEKLEGRIHLSIADARGLPLKNTSFDVVTMAFGIRNIEERQTVLSEFSRILRPGGQLLIMEFGFPDNPILRRLYRGYFDWVLPPLGNWLSRTNYAYTHLVQSVRAFPGDEEFMREISASGFVDLKVKNLTLGIARIFSGIKPRVFLCHASPLPARDAEVKRENQEMNPP